MSKVKDSFARKIDTKLEPNRFECYLSYSQLADPSNPGLFESSP